MASDHPLPPMPMSPGRRSRLPSQMNIDQVVSSLMERQTYDFLHVAQHKVILNVFVWTLLNFIHVICFIHPQ